MTRPVTAPFDEIIRGLREDVAVGAGPNSDVLKRAGGRIHSLVAQPWVTDHVRECARAVECRIDEWFSQSVFRHGDEGSALKTTLFADIAGLRSACQTAVEAYPARLERQTEQARD